MRGGESLHPYTVLLLCAGAAAEQPSWGRQHRKSFGYWLGQVADPKGDYWCPVFDGMAPTCDQCVRGAGGLSALPPSTACGQCARTPQAATCEKCWESLPQVFGVAEQEMNIKTRCHLRSGAWDLEKEHFCGGDPNKNPLVKMAGLVQGGESWITTVLGTAPLCEHICRRFAFKLGSDQVCCSVRDGEDYPAPTDDLQTYGYPKDGMCKAIAGIDVYSPEFKPGQMYKCTDMHRKDPRIQEGCWARRNGWAQEVKGEHEWDTNQNRGADGKLTDPGVSRAITCEGLGAEYDSSGDIISVLQGFPAARAGMKTGMRLTAIEAGDPVNPLKYLSVPRHWVYLNDSVIETIKVSKDAIGATFFGNRIATVDPKQDGGLFQEMQKGWPEDWPRDTGDPGSDFNCPNPSHPAKFCFPAYRRGARPGMIIKTVNGKAIESQWDIENAIATSPAIVEFGIQVDSQAVADRAFQGSSPDNICDECTPSIHPRKDLRPVENNHGVTVMVAVGPAKLPIRGVSGGAEVGGNTVQKGSGAIDANHGTYFPLGESGAPCEACSRQLPSVSAFTSCMQGMCDWSEKVIGTSSQTPYKKVNQVHSWEACTRDCCVDDNCAAVEWKADALECDLLGKPYDGTLVGSGKVAQTNMDCKAGCVSDKVCEWTAPATGMSAASVIQTVPNVPSLDACKKKCCNYGGACKAVSLQGTECELLAQLFDASPVANGTATLSNKWNGPLNPTCKWCFDSMPDLDPQCNACKQKGLHADCRACWDGFANLGEPCKTCWSVMQEFWPAPPVAAAAVAAAPFPWLWVLLGLLLLALIAALVYYLLTRPPPAPPVGKPYGGFNVWRKTDVAKTWRGVKIDTVEDAHPSHTGGKGLWIGDDIVAWHIGGVRTSLEHPNQAEATTKLKKLADKHFRVGLQSKAEVIRGNQTLMVDIEHVDALKYKPENWEQGQKTEKEELALVRQRSGALGSSRSLAVSPTGGGGHTLARASSRRGLNSPATSPRQPAPARSPRVVASPRRRPATSPRTYGSISAV